jgi:hypothetical protein
MKQSYSSLNNLTFEKFEKIDFWVYCAGFEHFAQSLVFQPLE